MYNKSESKNKQFIEIANFLEKHYKMGKKISQNFNKMIICKQLNIDDSTEYLPKYTSLHIENYFFKKKSLLLSRNN